MLFISYEEKKRIFAKVEGPLHPYLITTTYELHVLLSIKSHLHFNKIRTGNGNESSYSVHILHRIINTNSCIEAQHVNTDGLLRLYIV